MGEGTERLGEAEDGLVAAVVGTGSRSFPSGHAAGDLAFVFRKAQELPIAFVPLSACALSLHWSLLRKRAHYPSDVLVGGALVIAVALTMWKLWPPRRPVREETSLVPSGGGEADGQASESVGQVCG